MKPELQKKLYEKYPKIFQGRNKSIRESLIPFGFECGDGWYDLIDKLCSQLQWNTDKNDYPQVEATQVKEKFGGLRFYYNIIPEEKGNIDDKWLYRQCGVIDGLVSFAEHMSECICEKCGTNQDVTQTTGWISTLCKKCLKEK